MMSDLNIDIVKQTFEAFGEGDIERIVSFQTEDSVWDHSGPAGVPFNRAFEGHDGVRDFFQQLASHEEATAVEVRDIIGSGDVVVAVGHFTFKVHATGKTWSSDFAMVYTFRDGLVSHWRPIFDMTAEAEAFRP